mgnify:FL=1
MLYYIYLIGFPGTSYPMPTPGGGVGNNYTPYQTANSSYPNQAPYPTSQPQYGGAGDFNSFCHITNRVFYTFITNIFYVTLILHIPKKLLEKDLVEGMSSDGFVWPCD